jgi:hypothetical protein
MFTRVRRYTKFGRKPRNAVAALKQARDFLVEEGQQHWAKGAVYGDINPSKTREINSQRPTNPDDPLCGNWGVCAVGAVALVTGDLEQQGKSHVTVCHRPSRFYPPVGSLPRSAVYDEAVNLLDEVAEAAGHGSIIDINDDRHTTRKRVIAYFNKAIALGEAEANKRRGRNALRTKQQRAYA